MPIFKLKCRQCGHIFEFFFKSASASAECPFCNSDDLDKLPSEIAAPKKSTSPNCSAAPVCPNAASCGCCCKGLDK